MTIPPPKSNLRRQRREEAEARLRIGLAPPMQVTPPSIDALKVLHDLASSPTTASEALKFLNELQVHQVKLDLVDLQLQEAVRETTEQFSRYKALYDHAPAGYVVVTLDGGHIIEANLAGAQLLGGPIEQLEGRPLSQYLAGASPGALAVLLDRVEAEAVSCSVELLNGGDGVRSLHATATLSPGGEAALVALIDCTPR